MTLDSKVEAASPPAQDSALREALLDVLASLVAAHSLLSRSSKKAAPSDKMFDQMLADYAASIERGRAALQAPSTELADAKAEIERLRGLPGIFTAIDFDEYADVPSIVGVTMSFDNGEEILSFPFGDLRRARAIKEGR